MVAMAPDMPGISIPFSSGQEITQSLTVAPEIFHRDPLQKVEFYVDSQLAFTAAKSPYVFPWDISSLANGDHKLAVKAYDASGDIGEAQVTVRIALDHAGVIKASTAQATQAASTKSNVLIPWPVIIGAILTLAILVGAGLWYYEHNREEQFPPVDTIGPDVVPDFKSESTFPTEPPTKPEIPTDGLVQGPISEPGTISAPPSGTVGIPGAQTADQPTQILHTKQPPKTLAYLFMKKGTHEGRPFSLSEGETTIGRGGDNDIPVDDPTASRYHAKVQFRDEKFFIQDLAATNPTQVNGEDIVRQQLSDGDRIQIGETIFVFKKV